jgi:acetyl-CoA C-acetyltransferase
MNPSDVPVVVGVGQLRNNRSRTLEEAKEPLDLIVDSVSRAAEDCGVGYGLLAAIDSLSVVRVQSWAYDDLPGRIAAAVGAHPVRTEYSDGGGNRPVELLDQAAARIARRTSKVEVVCGGEALASLTAYTVAQQSPPWSTTPGGRVVVAERDFATDLMIRYGLTYPVRAYPLYENGLRAELGQDYAAAQSWSARIYAQFSEVAAKNPAAWDQIVRTPDEIATVTERNRFICYPYPLLMNAQPRVDQAAAVIVTSLATARELGIAEDKLVYVWGGAGAADSADIFERVYYTHSPAMDAVFSRLLGAAQITAAELDVVDLYSCFPVVPKLAARSLGVAPTVPLSVTGGLTSFGGPANNYSTHAIIATVERIRRGAGVALVYGNGELLTKHHAVLLSARSHADGYLQPSLEAGSYERAGPSVLDGYVGPGSVETFTVEFGRDGSPTRAWIIGRTPTGKRFPARSTDPAVLAALTDPAREGVGRGGVAGTDEDGLTTFTPDDLGVDAEEGTGR